MRLALLAVFLLVAPATAQHGSWHDEYRSFDGIRCCGPRDCHPAQVALLEWSKDRVMVVVEGQPVAMHPQSVHISEDTQGWVCKTLAGAVRCVFYAVGS